ncbi:hypothetical protein LguiA_004612 [Lonicera macranthoides]
MPTFLSLAHNKLEGSIPDSLGKLINLELLDLSNNNLCGPIPKSFEGLKVLYIELLQATNGFTENNLLGVRGGGSVYKGILDAVNVLVKVVNLQSEEAFKSFDIECEFLRNIRHRNLTKIVSSCSNSDFLALVLQYLSNGSLEKWLYSHNYYLTILQRLDIMIDVASGLEYLHHGQRMPIIHCDLKHNNILIDKAMITHVCGFGIAKLLGEEEFMAQTKTLATIGKKLIDEMFSDEMTMRSWVYEASLGSFVQVVDANLIGMEDENVSAKKECASSILHLALGCSTATERISMEDFVVRLNKIKITFLSNTDM